MAKRGKHQAPEERKIIRLQDYRRGGVRPAAETPEQEEPQPSQEPPREEGEERLERINRQLSPLEQRILALYLQGLSYRDIGRQVSRPVKSVDNAVQRIRRKVAKAYGVFSES